MSISATEISDLIKKKIQGLDLKTEARTEGTVVSLSDGIAKIHGLSDVMQGEMIEFPGNTYGLALNLERDSVGAVILGTYEHISEGDVVKCTQRILEVPVGEALLGRVVDSLGVPIDGKGDVACSESSPIEKIAPGVIARQSVSEPLQTGLKSIDSMVPIGRGQRELIIGDRQTGKTALAVDTIINQKGTGIKCIYVAIGQKASSINAVIHKLEEHGALEHLARVGRDDRIAVQVVELLAGRGADALHAEFGSRHGGLLEKDRTSLEGGSVGRKAPACQEACGAG